jgi:hypothetical protein
MFKNIEDFRNFRRRVQILLEPYILERDIPLLPDSFFGCFSPRRLNEVMSVCCENPEFHIVSCIEPELFINGFIKNALIYYLADGDSDPNLVHDPHRILDVHLLQALNSGLSKRCA